MKNFDLTFENYSSEVNNSLKNIDNKKIDLFANKLQKALQESNKIIILGNGGSAAQSQHFAAELVSRFNFDRNPLPSIALTTDTSILTAIANDYGYEKLFERQLKGLSKSGDIFIGLTIID